MILTTTASLQEGETWENTIDAHMRSDSDYNGELTRGRDLGILRSLARSKYSGVRLFPDHKLTLSMDQSFCSSLVELTTDCPSSQLRQFDPKYGLYCVLI